ncbi:MAG: septal ring lytic transglycosylase RlpA family protein [Synechococcales cyanobacterium T60_A2020_003]|nr:septal ring lytic transglycosylase RlpA family protein [Synechococcales cyanobacterium T60_A2020_003]
MIQNKKNLWGSLAVTLLVTTWSAAIAPSQADSRVTDSGASAAQNSVSEERSEDQNLEAPESSVTLSNDLDDQNQDPASVSELADSTESMEASNSAEVVKVGEYQSQEQTDLAEDAIANILPHDMNGRNAATLYVRNIPVLTFLGSSSDSSTSAPASSLSASNVQPGSIEGEEVKIASVQAPSDVLPAESAASEVLDQSDPVLRATAIAATLNQLDRQGVDAESISVKWDGDEQAYVITVGDEVLARIDDDTILPDTTRDHAEDALQATNRLRRLLGSAPPLDEIEGDPHASQGTLVSAVQAAFSGLASWYGPGFDGNYSASGEIFNQNALTAAHPSLPFGTQVRVTNLDNGLSVIVRINDRGPHAPGRVIDLSTGAANVIGLVSAGVAPVSLEVVDSAQASAGAGR